MCFLIYSNLQEENEIVLVTIQKMRLAPLWIAFSIILWVSHQQITAKMWDVWISYFGIGLLNNYSLDDTCPLTLYSQWTVNDQVTYFFFPYLLIIFLSYLNKYFIGYFSHRGDGCYLLHNHRLYSITLYWATLNLWGQNFQSITVKMAAWRVWQKDAGTGV